MPFRAAVLRCLALFALSAAAACAQDPPATTAPAEPHCLPDGSGKLQASLRGAITADIDWSDTQMQCEGGPRPDGRGLRVTVAGPLLAATPGAAERTLRFIFGIDLHDSADGIAQALPTNLTLILEGEGQMFATRGDDRCAVEDLQRAPLPGTPRRDRVTARGYCISPAPDIAGDTRVLVATFSFSALALVEEAP